MKEIPLDIVDDVYKIVDELLIYKNEKNLSWTSSYNEVLKKLNMEDRKEDINLLSNVVSMVTKLGYDIEAIPFKLSKFI